jgi:hypothetical protein
MSVISFVKGINVTASMGHNTFNLLITSGKPIKIRRIASGIGVHWFYTVRNPRTLKKHWISGFHIINEFERPLPISQTQGLTQINLELVNTPCVGFISKKEEGCIIAPSIKLDIPMGKDIIVSLLTPKQSTHILNIEKPQLQAVKESGGAMASLTPTTDGVLCKITSYGGGYRSVRLVTRRDYTISDPRLPLGFTVAVHEQVLKSFQPGESGQVLWNPARHIFTPTLIIASSQLNKKQAASLLQALGWPAKKGFLKTKFNIKDVFAIADGSPIELSLKLVLDVPFGGDVEDSTKISIVM